MKRALWYALYLVVCAGIGCLVQHPESVGWAPAVLFGLTVAGCAMLSYWLDARLHQSSFGATKAPFWLTVAVVLGIYWSVPILTLGLLHAVLPSWFIWPAGFLNFACGMLGLPLLFGAWLLRINGFKLKFN